MLRPTCLLLATVASTAVAGEPVVITDRLHHLGTSRKPEWKEFTTEEPSHRSQLEVELQVRKEGPDFVLELQAGGVSTDWRVRFNDEDLGTLRRSEERVTQFFRVPAAAVRDGANRLRVSFPSFRRGTTDDIYVGKAILHNRPLRDVAGYARVTVRVRDPDSGEGLPSRLTLVAPVEKKDDRGRTRTSEELVDILPVKEDEVATRKGIIYTKKGVAAFDVLPGTYILYATRGFEYGLGVARLDLGKNEDRNVELDVRREVDTTGLIAADTHVHTRTYSGHGDATLEERVISIVGEGIELAVATDHNHHTDYRPTLEKEGLKGDFLPVIGNEVTTDWGHFGAFPLDKDRSPVDYHHSDWEGLVQAMRASSGVRVLIVNHPRRTLSDASTFGHIGLNSVSGEAHEGPASLGIDAVEVVNGKTLEEDRMLTLRDWLGMLNRGHKVAAVAGSDSHAIGEIVGQARNYVSSSTDDPRKLRLDELCDAFLAGRLLISLGLLAQVEVNGKHRPGDLATGLGEELEVAVKVQGPSWTRADSVTLYLNGIEARREKVEATERPIKYQAVWKLPRPAHDTHLVVVASGPPVTAPYWPISGDGKRYLLGATNAVWLDGDGDGRFTPALEYATRIVKAHGWRGEGTREALRRHDAAVAAQFASLARAEVESELQTAYERLLGDADAKLAEILAGDDPALKGFDKYLEAAPKLDANTRSDREAWDAKLKKEAEGRKKRQEEARKKSGQGRRGRL